MGNNLWDLVHQIVDPQGWREKKVGQLRQQWGYDATSPIKNQGDSRYSNQVFSDSFPAPQNPRDLSGLYTIDARNKEINERDAALMKGAPDWFPERYDLNLGIRNINKDMHEKYKMGI